MKIIYEIVQEEDGNKISIGLYSHYDTAKHELEKLFNKKSNRISGEERRWLNDSEFAIQLGLSYTYIKIETRKLIDNEYLPRKPLCAYGKKR